MALCQICDTNLQLKSLEISAKSDNGFRHPLTSLHKLKVLSAQGQCTYRSSGNKCEVQIIHT